MGDIREIQVPDIGDFDAVDVVEILVAPGDTVKAEESLITLESDKASMDVPSPFAGTVKEIKVDSGGQVAQGDVIVLLEMADADKPASGPEAETVDEPKPESKSEPEPKPESEPEPKPAAVASKDETAKSAPAQASPIDQAGFDSAYASPSVRRLARELEVDLGAVKGTGRKGRITQDDLHSWIKQRMSGGSVGTGGGVLPPMPEIDFSKFGPIETEPLTKIQKVGGANLSRAWLHVPHVTQFDEADITDLDAFRRAHADEAKSRGIKLTLLPFLMKAAVAGLKQFERFNSSLAPGGEELILKRYFHIGIAVDTEQGLVVPVIRDVDQKSLYDLAEELGDVSERARNRKLRPDDLSGAGFTISSLGGLGGTNFTPIVNAPEVAILGVARAQMKPVWQKAENEFEPRLVIPFSLSYDHRVIDGAAGVRFTSFISRQLSDIRRLLL